MSIPPPRTLAISAPELRQETLSGWLAALTATPPDAVQLRCKELGDAALVELARQVREGLDGTTGLLVNGRWDLCLLAGGDGVHLPAAGLPVAAVRRGLGAEALIGRSTHSLDEVCDAADEGADYVTFGPVFPTPSKERYGPPVGLQRLAEAVDVGLPVLALGGITTMGRVRECIAEGAWGVAGIRLFAEATSAAECVDTVRALTRDE